MDTYTSSSANALSGLPRFFSLVLFMYYTKREKGGRLRVYSDNYTNAHRNQVHFFFWKTLKMQKSYWLFLEGIRIPLTQSVTFCYILLGEADLICILKPSPEVSDHWLLLCF